jgi:6-phosphogluconolactonase
MKKIKGIILVLSMMFAVSCMDMYNDLADEFGEYNYYIAVADQSSIFRTYEIDKNGGINFISKKSVALTAPRLPSASPSGEYIYIPDGTNHTLSVYKVSDDGSLVSIGTPIDTEGTTSLAAKAHPSGKYVYVSNQGSGTISMFAVKDDGTLQKIASPISTGGSSFPGRMAFHPSGNCLYVALNSGGGFAVCKIGSNGEIISSTTFSLTDNTQSIVVHPDGNYLYISTATKGIYKCNIKNDGTIDPGGTINVTGTNFNLSHLVVHPDGTYLYSAKGQYVYVFSINAVDGSHSYIEQTNYTLGSISDIIINPTGDMLYVSDFGGSHLFMVHAYSNGTVEFDDNYDTGMSYNGLALIRKKK